MEKMSGRKVHRRGEMGHTVANEAKPRPGLPDLGHPFQPSRLRLKVGGRDILEKKVRIFPPLKTSGR